MTKSEFEKAIIKSIAHLLIINAPDYTCSIINNNIGIKASILYKKEMCSFASGTFSSIFWVHKTLSSIGKFTQGDLENYRILMICMFRDFVIKEELYKGF